MILYELWGGEKNCTSQKLYNDNGLAAFAVVNNCTKGQVYIMFIYFFN